VSAKEISPPMCHEKLLLTDHLWEIDDILRLLDSN
jgi:hypothetical protein